MALRTGALRVPIWKINTLAKQRRHRIFRECAIAFSGFLLLAIFVTAYKFGWWTTLLDWAVVAIPAIAGLVAWLIPVKDSTRFHRVWLFICGVILSGLIYLQQWETGVAHAKEIAKLATKEDIAKLPTAVDIVKELLLLRGHLPLVQLFKESPGI